MAKGKITAQQLKHDPLMDKYIASSGWVKERSGLLLKGLIGAAALGAAILIFYVFSSQRARSASDELAIAFCWDQAIVANPIPPNPQGCAAATEDEKHHKAYDAFEKAARDYPSYNGEVGRYLAATHQLYFDGPKAEVTLQEIAQKSSSVGAQARLALAQRYETTNRFNEAVAEYQKLKAQPGDISPLLIDFNIARTYEAMGKKQEAIDLYFAVASQGIGSGLGTGATTRLTALDPSRLEQLPQADKKTGFGALMPSK